MAAIDWAIVGALMVLIVMVGILVKRRASENSTAFFLAGRNMPWWLLGFSMVATTFAADTPNLVTNLVRTNGVSGNWVWWCFLITGMITAFIYAKLWRRLGVSTDIEFYEQRYSGKPAAFLRGFRAVYLGVFFNVIIMANVTLAAIKFGAVLFDISPLQLVTVAGLVTVTFSVVGGLLGVLITDLILFLIAMLGSFIAAYFAVQHPDIGSLETLISHENVVDKLAFLPDLSDPNSFVPLLLVPLAVQWWSAWYPGAEPGGGGYVAQRMLAAKGEKHAVAATVFFNFVHVALRPWPWIIVALASLVVFPDLASLAESLPNIEQNIVRDDLAYPAMLMFLPTGYLGIVAASLIAAYVSTISTSLNWGASYVVKDVYVRFFKPNASEGQQVQAGRFVTVILMILAAITALLLEDALQGFQLLLSIGAGTGLLFLLRWFWSRLNAWSEISAMIISFSVNMWLEFWGPEMADWAQYLIGVGVTTVGWVLVTFLTPRTDFQTLNGFSKKMTGASEDRSDILSSLLAAFSGLIATYGTLFGIGHALYGNIALAGIFLLVAIGTGWFTIMKIKNSEEG